MGTQEEKELVCPLVNRVGEPAESSRLRLMVVVTVLAPSHGERQWNRHPNHPLSGCCRHSARNSIQSACLVSGSAMDFNF